MLQPDSPICVDCIGNVNLRKRMRKGGLEAVCAHCGKLGRSLLIYELADIVDKAFKNFYEEGQEFPEWNADDDHTSWAQEGDPLEEVIENLIDANSEIANALASYLEGRGRYAEKSRGTFNYYNSESNYVEANLNTHEHFEIWSNFQYQINHAKRFYDSMSEQMLREIFKDIETFSLSGTKPPVKIIDPTVQVFRIFRARKAVDLNAAKKIHENLAEELGPPPIRKATAGRMNPAGISVFYGALDVDTCISELRPTVGSYVVHAAFIVSNTIKVLDLSVFDSRILGLDVFDETVYAPLRRWKFLQSFHRTISRSVQPEDEPMEYIATQAVAEYLRNILGLDGIIYSSPQAGEGKNNIVLFNMHAPISHHGSTDEDDLVNDYYREQEEEERAELGSRAWLHYVEGTATVSRVTSAKYDHENLDSRKLSLPF